MESAEGIVGFIPNEAAKPSRAALRAYAKAVIFHPTLEGEPHACDSRTWITPLVDLI